MTSKTITAIFHPQAWQRDIAVSIDGDRCLDVTEKVLSYAAERIRKLNDNSTESDYLVCAHSLGHGGPYWVEVEHSICEYFGVDELAGISDEMVEEARRRSAEQAVEAAPSML